MKKYLLFLMLLSTVTLFSCSKNSSANDGHDHSNESEQADAHGAEGEDVHSEESHSEGTKSAHSDEIVVTPEKAKEAGVETLVVEPKSFRQVIKTSGQIESAQGNESTVVANVAGIVSFNRPVVAGMSVTKGTALLSVSSDNLPDGDPVIRARNVYATSKSEYERASKLVKSQIISQKEFERIKENYENTRLSYEAISKHRSGKGVSVVSPMSGYIKSCMVNEGDYVTVGQPLMRVTQTKRLYLRADVSEKYYSDLANMKSANFKTPYNNQIYQLDELKGRLLTYGKSSGENSYFIPVTFEFDNKGDIVPGAFVDVYLLSSEMQNILSLPISAITEEQGLYFIYKKIDEEGYKKQEVKLGMNNGKEVQILSGLQAGETIVVKGAYQIKLASASNAIPSHSHEH